MMNEYDEDVMDGRVKWSVLECVFLIKKDRYPWIWRWMKYLPCHPQ